MTLDRDYKQLEAFRLEHQIENIEQQVAFHREQVADLAATLRKLRKAKAALETKAKTPPAPMPAADPLEMAIFGRSSS